MDKQKDNAFPPTNLVLNPCPLQPPTQGHVFGKVEIMLCLV